MAQARQEIHGLAAPGAARGVGEGLVRRESALRAVPARPAPTTLARRVAADVARRYRWAERFVVRRSAVRAAMAVPRTLGFLGSALTTGNVADAVPAPTLTVALAAQVAMDEALLALAMTPSRFPHRADYEQVESELHAARRLHARRGWSARPGSYHRRPPALTDGDLHRSHHSALGTSYERIAFDSGFTPRPDEPGAERWSSYLPNRTAVAHLVRHASGDRPWVIAVHGFCMGSPVMDFRGLHVARVHRELGMNVALPVLPLHGPRKVTRLSGEALLSFQLMNAVHGLTQAVWDIRRLIGWVRTQGATSISLYGVSLGGYVVSLLAGLEDGIDAVVAGIPVSDLPVLFGRHSPPHVRDRAVEHHILDGTADEVFRVVAPMSFDARVPWERRFVFAGYGDRLALPDQAQRLWRHWDEPSICWYPGNHVGYLWSRQVGDYVADSLCLGASSKGRAPTPT